MTGKCIPARNLKESKSPDQWPGSRSRNVAIKSSRRGHLGHNDPPCSGPGPVAGLSRLLRQRRWLWTRTASHTIAKSLSTSTHSHQREPKREVELLALTRKMTQEIIFVRMRKVTCCFFSRSSRSSRFSRSIKLDNNRCCWWRAPGVRIGKPSLHVLAG